MKKMLILAKKLNIKSIIPLGLAVVFMAELSFPQAAQAQTLQMPKFLAFFEDRLLPAAEAQTTEDTLAFDATETQNSQLQPKKVVYVTVTAYSSDPAQTDDTPCITANGFDVCKHNEENIIAANFMKFGTQVRFPEYNSDQYFYVNDRMNARYTNRIDIWMKSKEAAKEFGVKRLKVEVY